MHVELPQPHAVLIVFLWTSGVGEAGITVLEEDSVLTTSVFVSLREEHFEKLLPKLNVGEHATLLKARSNREVQYSPTIVVADCSTS